MENFNVNDNIGYLGIPRYFKTISYRLDFSDTAQHYPIQQGKVYLLMLHMLLGATKIFQGCGKVDISSTKYCY